VGVVSGAHNLAGELVGRVGVEGRVSLRDCSETIGISVAK
jgi:hypothetical protein